MRNYIKKFLAFIFFSAIVAILYLIVAFIEWNFNPKEWCMGARAFLSLFPVIILVTTITIFRHSE